MKRWPMLSSLLVGAFALALTLVAYLLAIGVWEPRWLVECTNAAPPRTVVAAPKPDLQTSTFEVSVSETTCTDRRGIPFSLATGVLAAALTYRRIARSRGVR